MVRKKITVLILLIFLFGILNGCVPAVMDKVELQQIEIPITPPFVPPGKIEKPEKPDPVFLDANFNLADDMDAVEYFAFRNEEFAKIVQLSQAFDIQEQLLYIYVDIINGEVDVNNDLKEMLARKDLIARHFSDLYINEQNLRLQENYQYGREKILDRILIFLQTGVILALIL